MQRCCLALRSRDAEGSGRAGHRGPVAKLLSRHHPAGAATRAPSCRRWPNVRAFRPMRSRPSATCRTIWPCSKSGVSIAMGNATDDVKKLATHVTGSNEDEGFAGAIEFVLKRNASWSGMRLGWGRDDGPFFFSCPGRKPRERCEATFYFAWGCFAILCLGSAVYRPYACRRRVNALSRRRALRPGHGGCVRSQPGSLPLVASAKADGPK